MATDYSSLQAEIAGYLHRSDLTSNITSTFIPKAEARMNRMMLLRTQEQEATLSLTSGTDNIALPSDFLSPIACWYLLNTFRYDIEKVLPDQLTRLPSQNYPRQWAIDNTVIRFDCPAQTTLTIYFRYLNTYALSNSATTNYLLTNAPDLYAAACMVEAYLYTLDDENMQKWEQIFQQRAREFKAKETRNRDTTLKTDLPVGSNAGFNIYRGY